MPTADPDLHADGHRGAPGVAEEFSARDSGGRAVVVEKLVAQALENDIGGLEWSRSGPAYRLKNGGTVERIDESTFRIADSGELLRREEGYHGITHHPEHQTPAGS